MAHKGIPALQIPETLPAHLLNLTLIVSKLAWCAAASHSRWAVKAGRLPPLWISFVVAQNHNVHNIPGALCLTLQMGGPGSQTSVLHKAASCGE